MSGVAATAVMPAAGASAPTPGGGARPSLPEGAQCAVHAARAARFVCARCGTYGCVDCYFGGEPPPGADRVSLCRACAEGGLPDPIPWERRRELGWWRSFVDTTKLASLEPRRFFRTPSIERGALGGILYGIAAYALGQLLYGLAIAVLLILGGAVAGAATREPVIAGVLAGYGCLFAGLTPLMMAQVPVYALMGMMVAGGAAHGTLALLKRTKGKFEDTLRAVGYAYAPFVWFWIPACGPLVAYVWMLAVELVAIRETHRVGNDHAALAVFGFRALLLLLVLGGYAALTVLVILYAPGPHTPGGGPVDQPPFGE